MRYHCFQAIAVIIASLALPLTGCDKTKQDPVSEKADLVVYGNIYTAFNKSTYENLTFPLGNRHSRSVCKLLWKI